MRLFTDILREVGAGRLVDELSEKMQGLVAAVSATGRPGKITLELSVRPNGNTAVILTDKVKLKEPEPKHGDNVFFIVGSGDLTRSDPRQAELPLRRIVETEKKEVAHV